MSSSYIYSNGRKNPSRKACEEIIENILKRELEANGKNHHFKHASDFISYFESLYPASPALTKQVQRAIASMNLPRDKDGYFMIGKSKEEYEMELKLCELLSESDLHILDSCQPLFLKTDPWNRQQLIHILQESQTLLGLYDTLLETNNGVLVFTSHAVKLSEILNSYIKKD